MTNNQNWENENAEVSTEERDENVVGAVVPETDDAADITDTDSATSDELGENVTDDEKNSECSEQNGLNRKQKGIIITVGIILLLLLLWLLYWAFNINRVGDRGVDDINPRTDTVDTTSSTDGTSESQTDPRDENDGTDTSSASDTGNGQHIYFPTPGDNNQNGGNNNSKGNGSGGNNGTDDSHGGNNKPADTDKPDTPSSGDQNGGNTTPSDDKTGGNTGDNGGNGNGGNGGNGGNSGETTKPANPYPDYSGETTVRISAVNENTGIITITVDGGSISVPVQTTVFNGRITKSGVAQGKMFGYTCGATVMLFYPQDVGFANTEVTGFMSRNDDGLTVMVDINGDGSKLLIKINGMKSLF